ncbi:MAG TPA: hypothetical protein IAC66_01400 [Candidatus Aphodousia gallistercoris]|nr:hypothetical protein [Candidatus Aphodousia gallistercoris]
MKKYKFKDPRRGYDYKIQSGPMAYKKEKAKMEPIDLSLFVTKYVKTYVGGIFGGYYTWEPLDDPTPLWMQIIALILQILGAVFVFGCAAFVWWLFDHFC